MMLSTFEWVHYDFFYMHKCLSVIILFFIYEEKLYTTVLFCVKLEFSFIPTERSEGYANILIILCRVANAISFASYSFFSHQFNISASAIRSTYNNFCFLSDLVLLYRKKLIRHLSIAQ